MKTNEKELTIEQAVTRDCPILFRMLGRPLTESIISFGFECGKGWHKIIADTCRELEMLNIENYKKYRVRIQADQIKSKYGELRFYYSVTVDPNAFITWLANKYESIYHYFNDYNRFKYKMKKVVDIEPFDYDDIKEISEERYNEVTDPEYKGIKCSNVEYLSKDGKFFEVCHLRNYGKSHLVPTQHKIYWYIKEFANKMYYRLMSFPKKDNSVLRNCIHTMDVKAEEIIKRAEYECSVHCEECGYQIGTDWSPVCQTTGWISYICEDCAEKQSGNYIKNGELWNGKECLKTKEEMEKSKYHEI